jgi:ATP-dependent DNA helicase PIF1
MRFSAEQQQAFNLYLSSENIFLTGPGGTGKTALIREIYKDAISKAKDIQVCAMTGCAAVLLECKAKTLHSWAGIGLGNGTIEELLEKIKKNRFSVAMWKTTDILIVDEVSMMSKRMFDLIDGIARHMRKEEDVAFGGMQVIFSGDFYQLPPVGDRYDENTTKFCFESNGWLEAFPLENHILLKTIFRQSDPTYQNILNQIREGKLKQKSNKILLDLVTKSIDENIRIKPTKLFPLRSQVDYINNQEMDKLKGEEFSFSFKFHCDLDMTPVERQKRLRFTQKEIEIEYNYLKSNLRCDSEVKLKIGAQVMCCVNIKMPNEEMLCNGAQGIVVEFNHDNLPVVQFQNGIRRVMSYHVWESENIPGIGVSQVPLMLAWAVTIHKSQGASLDIAEVDAGTGIFECGQTYVALSRVKSLEGLYLCSFDASKIRVNRKSQIFYERIELYHSNRPGATNEIK